MEMCRAQVDLPLCRNPNTYTLCFFIRTSNFGAEAERSYIFFRFEAEKCS